MRFHPPTAFMFAAGLAALGVTGWQVRATAVFSNRAVHATGVIVEPTPHPRIRFAATDGTLFTFTQNGFVSRPPGAEVPIAFDPRDPGGTAQAWTFWTSWGTALWLLPAGLGFTLLPLFGYRAGVRGR